MSHFDNEQDAAGSRESDSVLAGWPHTWSIRQIDTMLNRLREQRLRCVDPGDILRTGESIDQWLDERLLLMCRAESERIDSQGSSRTLVAR